MARRIGEGNSPDSISSSPPIVDHSMDGSSGIDMDLGNSHGSVSCVQDTGLDNATDNGAGVASNTRRDSPGSSGDSDMQRIQKLLSDMVSTRVSNAHNAGTRRSSYEDQRFAGTTPPPQRHSPSTLRRAGPRR